MIDMKYWCESCARKNNCYFIRSRPKCFLPMDEPQKCYIQESCDHYGDKQVCGRCREYNLYSHTKTEPQTEDEILREQCRAFIDIVEQTDCGRKKGEDDEN